MRDPDRPARAAVPVARFFFNDTATTEIYTLSLHDALPIWKGHHHDPTRERPPPRLRSRRCIDRKSTRLNSSHHRISYAVFCLKKTNRETAWIGAAVYPPFEQQSRNEHFGQ